MKKSLQYVLMMSALGLQSGVLLAQMKVVEPLEVVGQTMGDWIPMAELQTMIDSERKKVRGRGFNEDLSRTLLTYIKSQSPLEKFTPNALMGLEYKNKVLVLNALTKNLDGAKFVNALPEDVRKKILKEVVDRGLFEAFDSIDEIQGPMAIASYESLGINSPQLNLTEESKRRIRAALNTPSEKFKSKESNLTLNQFVGGAFLTGTLSFPDTMNKLLQNNAVATDALISLSDIIASPEFTKIDKAYFLGSILGTGPGRAVYAKVPPLLKKEITQLAEDIKTNNRYDDAILINFGVGLFQAAKEHPNKMIMSEKDWKHISLKMMRVAKRNPTIPLEKKIKLLKVVNKYNLAAEEFDVYAEYKNEVLKAVPKEKLDYVRRFLSDSNSKIGDDELELYGISKKQKDQKPEDAKKVVPEFKDSQKVINNDEVGGALDARKTNDKEQKTIDKAKK